MKRILIFSLAYYPAHVGGAEVAIKEITDRIPPDEIEFDMVCLRFDSALPRTEKIGNVLVHRIGFAVKGGDISRTHHPLFYIGKIFFVPLAVLHGIRLHYKKHFDGMWAMMAYMTFPIVIMRFLRIIVPYVLTLQEGDPFERVFNRWYIKLFKPLLFLGFKKATVIQTISNFLAGWARDMGFKGDPVVIPNAVNTKHFSQIYDEAQLQALRQALGKRAGDTYLITTSRLVEKNGIGDVITALVNLPDSVKFLILGIGPLEETLKEQARALGVGERVMFLGQIDHKEMPKYLAVSDVFIRPSLSEGMGNSFIEAMAAGLPVIATQEGGIADFLFDPERNPDREPTGFAVDPRNPIQIAERVRSILSDKELVSRTVRNAKAMAFEKYDWDLIARDMREKVFAVLLKTPTR